MDRGALPTYLCAIRRVKRLRSTILLRRCASTLYGPSMGRHSGEQRGSRDRGSHQRGLWAETHVVDRNADQVEGAA